MRTSEVIETIGTINNCLCKSGESSPHTEMLENYKKNIMCACPHELVIILKIQGENIIFCPACGKEYYYADKEALCRIPFAHSKILDLSGLSLTYERGILDNIRSIVLEHYSECLKGDRSAILAYIQNK